MTNFNNYPLNILINRLSDEKGSRITFDELKLELMKKNGETPFYYISFKENDDLCILYYDNFPKKTDSTHDKFAEQLEQSLRSCIIEKDTLRIISTQFNRIVYNENTISLIKNTTWDQVVVSKCHEGTMLIIFNHNDKWYVSTRRCLEASESKWIRNKSYGEMFDETIKDKFSFNDLDKENIYYFVLVHYKNRNIVDNSQIGENYKNVIHTMTLQKYTLKEINYVINDLVTTPVEVKFPDLESLLVNLNNININDEKNKHISTEGYILRIYDGTVNNSLFTITKLQTELYQKIMKIKPNNNNFHQIFLELYQKDYLHDFLPYFTKYSTDVVKRIGGSIKTISKEILDIYHATRKKKNQELYNNLKDQYKKFIYELHGHYIKNREKDFMNNAANVVIDKVPITNNIDDITDISIISQNKHKSRPIRVHDVYHHLKKSQPQQLRKLYYERMLMLDEGTNMYLDKSCINTKAQSSLMFNDLNIKQPSTNDK
jgi:hypothetical protein